MDSSLLEDDADRLLFHQLCQGFDSAVLQRYQPMLNELKHLFDPINPDNETVENRRVAYRDRLENEYWLLQKIDNLLHRANFTEVPRDVLLDKFLLHNDSTSSSTLQMRFEAHTYDVLKFWALGRETMPSGEKSWWKKILDKNQPITSRDYFKRVIVAVRLKGQDRLFLKAFRDVPLQHLTHLLPVGQIQIGQFDRRLLGASAVIGASAIVTHLVSTMANHPLTAVLIGGTSLSVAGILLSMHRFHQSKSTFLANINRTLFYKNVASNKQLLAMIVDRAEDELSKEVSVKCDYCRRSLRH
jgi:hypothetical protein